MKLHLPSILLCFGVFIGMGMQMVVQPIPCGLTAEQQAVLDLLTVETLDDCMGGPGYKTLRLTGANFQVVNGLGTTDTVNGLGNLIVGYNEPQLPCDRSGSHNAILGQDQDYNQHSGLTTGIGNQLLGTYNVVFGAANLANNDFSNVLGGIFNTSSHRFSIVVGGATNVASGEDAVVVGGEFNQATQRDGVTVGGQGNLNHADKGVLVGGRQNTLFGPTSVVSGGFQRSAVGQDDWVAGSLFQDN